MTNTGKKTFRRTIALSTELNKAEYKYFLPVRCIIRAQFIASPILPS